MSSKYREFLIKINRKSFSKPTMPTLFLLCSKNFHYFKDLSKFGHVYLDMSLGCPGSTDFTCPHWDHTVQLYLNCGESRVQCKGNKKKRSHHQVRLGPEIGRWITPFRRLVVISLFILPFEFRSELTRQGEQGPIPFT